MISTRRSEPVPSEPGLSLSAYIVRAVRRQAVLDAAQHLAELGLGDDLCAEGDVR
jgi:hypothetical protein